MKQESEEEEEEDSGSGSEEEEEEEEDDTDGKGDNSKQSISRPKNETSEDRRVSEVGFVVLEMFEIFSGYYSPGYVITLYKILVL